MSSTKIKLNRDLWLGLVILVLSLLNLISVFSQKVDLSIIVSFIGVVGFLLQINQRGVYKFFYIIWVVAQIPLISIIEPLNGTAQQVDVLNLSQVFYFDLKFSISLNTKTFSIGVNLLALVYLVLLRQKFGKEFVNEEVTIIPNSPNSKISEFSPLKAEIFKYEKDWYTCYLKSCLKIDQSEFDLIRFKPKKGGFFKPKKERQLCSIKLASTVHGHEESDTGFVK
ncbi:hypothetical protein [Flagellimonas flava]|uniref:hypothetical protein n=1 Tax=Flagellimonas flava TaxID=570519 RepID=UPI003D64CD25